MADLTALAAEAAAVVRGARAGLRDFIRDLCRDLRSLGLALEIFRSL